MDDHLAALLLGSAASLPAVAQTTVRVGMIEDVDTLDPHQGRTLGGRHVFTALCDKLFDIDEQVNIKGRLVTSHEISADGLNVTLKLRPGVVFHDGTPFNAEAVKFNLERALTIQESARKGDIRAIDKVEVVDPLTAKLVLKEPFAPLLSQLSDRAGMMISPTAAAPSRRRSSATSRSARGRTSSSSASSRTASRSSASPTTGTRISSISTVPNTCRSPTRRCGSTTCSPASST